MLGFYTSLGLSISKLLTNDNEEAQRQTLIEGKNQTNKTMSVILTPVTQPTQSRATLAASDVTAFQNLLGGANLITLPKGKTASDIVSFVVNVQPNGGGFLQVSIK